MEKDLTAARLLKRFCLFSLLDLLLCLCVFGIPLVFCLPGPVSLPLSLILLLFSSSDPAKDLAAHVFAVFGLFYLSAVLLALLDKKPLPLLCAAAAEPLGRVLLLAALLREELGFSPAALLIGVGILVSAVDAGFLWREYHRERTRGGELFLDKSRARGVQ